MIDYFIHEPYLFSCSGGRKKTALVLKDVEHVVTFLVNFADTHALVLPGRVPGFMRDDVKVYEMQLATAFPIFINC
jgi:hypothetical protein